MRNATNQCIVCVFLGYRASFLCEVLSFYGLSGQGSKIFTIGLFELVEDLLVD